MVRRRVSRKRKSRSKVSRKTSRRKVSRKKSKRRVSRKKSRRRISRKKSRRKVSRRRRQKGGMWPELEGEEEEDAIKQRKDTLAKERARRDIQKTRDGEDHSSATRLFNKTRDPQPKVDLRKTAMNNAQSSSLPLPVTPRISSGILPRGKKIPIMDKAAMDQTGAIALVRDT